MLSSLLDDERSLRIGQTLNNQNNQPKLFIMKKAAFFAVMLAFVSLLGLLCGSSCKVVHGQQSHRCLIAGTE